MNNKTTNERPLPPFFNPIELLQQVVRLPKEILQAIGRDEEAVSLEKEVKEDVQSVEEKWDES